MATPSSTPIPLQGDIIDAAMQGYYWQLDASHTLKWGLANGPAGESWFSPPTVVSTLADIFANISSYANINFQYAGFFSTPFTAYAGGADLTVSLAGSSVFGSSTSTWAIGLFPNSAYNSIYQGLPGDVFLNVGSQANFLPSYAPGSAGYALAIHEIGHALGLKHPFDNGGTGHPTLSSFGLGALDKDWLTVMAYNDDYNYNLSFWDPATPMVLDVLALQALYGPNMLTNAGNSTFSLVQNNEYQTIWDAGGLDVIDVSSSSVSWDVSLPNIQLSNVVTTKIGAANPLAETGLTSPHTLYWLMGDIESVYGSNFADRLIGSNSGNLLAGGAGNDYIEGQGGNDLLDGGPGIDNMLGGLGNDAYVVDSVSDNITEFTGEGVDTVQTYVPWALGAFLENLTLLGSASYGVGNSGNNVLIGNDVSNPLLRGNGGADTIMDGDGNDWIEGDSNGNDAFPGVAGNDILYGDGGDDTLQGGAGDDLMYGGSGTDFLIADAGNDLVYGGSEWDAIDGRTGSDLLYGEGGDDIIFGDGYFYLYGFGNDTLYGGDGNDIMMGEAGEHYSFGGNDVIYGESGNDQIYGGAGNDVIYGGTGNDVIDGGDGFDYIVGGVGSEIMLGSNYVTPTSGSDLFVYQTMLDGGDSIYGFDTRPGENDAIDLRPLFDALGYAGTTPRADGYLYVFQNGANTDVYVDANGATGGINLTLMVTLISTTATSVPDGDFLFQ